MGAKVKKYRNKYGLANDKGRMLKLGGHVVTWTTKAPAMFWMRKINKRRK